MKDLSKEIRDCIDSQRSEHCEITVEAITRTFLESVSDGDLDQWKSELLESAIRNKVRAMLRSLEEASDGQLIIDGVEFPTYLCFQGPDGNNVWVHGDDAMTEHYRGWFEVANKNAIAVNESRKKRRQTLDLVEAATNGQNIPVKPALKRYLHSQLSESERAQVNQIAARSIGHVSV